MLLLTYLLQMLMPHGEQSVQCGQGIDLQAGPQGGRSCTTARLEKLLQGLFSAGYVANADLLWAGKVILVPPSVTAVISNTYSSQEAYMRDASSCSKVMVTLNHTSPLPSQVVTFPEDLAM